MTALIIIAVILFLILLIKGFVIFEYGSDGILLICGAGPIKITVLPEKESKKEEKKPKKKKEVKKEKAEKKGGTVELIKSLLPEAFDALGKLKRGIVIDELWLYYTSASSDPCKAAMSYGYASAAVGSLLALIENNFKLKKRNLSTNVSFTETEPTVYLKAMVSIRVYHIIYIALTSGLKLLKIYTNHTSSTKDRKAEK